MKKDIEKYINDNIKAEIPESLSKEKIITKLDTAESTIPAKNKFGKKLALRLVAAAAAVSLIISGTVIYENINKKENIMFSKTKNVKISDDYDAIYLKMSNLHKSYKESAQNFSYNVDVYGVVSDDTEFFSETSNSANKNPVDSYGVTNTQEKNIDEGDIIKTDGNNIYLADSDNRTVYIVKANNGEMSQLAEITFGNDTYIEELYLVENRLVVVYVKYDYSKQPQYPIVYNGVISSMSMPYEFCYASSWVYSETHIAVYDISDAEKPEKLSDYCQSGDFVSSRVKDGKLYLVSSYCVDIYADDYKKNCIPKTSADGEQELIPANKITLIEDTEAPTYAVISTFNIESAERTDSSAILGDASNVYATENSFYLVEQKWDGQNCIQYLKILKFKFTETGVEYFAAAKADGWLNSNLSMSEYDGYFRIATTCQVNKTVMRENGKGETLAYDGETNKLYIFDENMENVGLLDSFAKDEQIRSARYMGNYAYIVTFRQTDPLFVMNLSDPKNPKIEGELKLPGFSSYLHPIGNGMLVGVGDDGDDKGTNGKMKVSLFSIADPKNPKELSTSIIGNNGGYVSSDVSYSYKSFVNLPNGEFAIPFSVEDYSRTYNRKYGEVYAITQIYIRYSVVNGAVTEVARYEVGNDTTTIQGGTYIGNYFYTFSSDFIDENGRPNSAWQAKLTSFDMTANTPVSKIEL